MFLRVLAVSALAIGMAASAAAQNTRTSHTTDMFKGPRLQQAFGGAQQPSKDAILPNGNINVDPSVTGSIGGEKIFAQPRLQCDASPNTTGTRSNTYDLGTISGCP
jgi:hypothetical protein